jgi:uncharacterized phiE125 gp8 family phage protein
MERIETITPPTTTSVDLDMIKSHLKIIHDAEDDLLSEWLMAADDLFVRHTGYVLLTSTYRLRLDAWPLDGIIHIPRHPVTAVSSVQYLDIANAWQTISNSDYSTDLSSAPARVVFGSNATPGFGYQWPVLHPRNKPVVRVQFVAGHATAGATPALVRQAVRLLVGHWWSYRESHTTDILNHVPLGWKAVCDQFATGITGSWNEVSHAGR